MAAAYALLLVGCVMGGTRTHGPGPRVRPSNVAPPEASAASTDVVLTTTSPLPPGKNVLWSVAAQLAFDELADRVGVSGRLTLGPPASRELVAALNAGRFPRSDLDPDSYVVVVGQGAGDVVSRFQDGVRRLGGHAKPEDVPSGLRPSDLVAFAYVRKEMPFPQPFHVHSEPWYFAGGPRRVVGFGVAPEDTGTQAELMRRQVLVHVPDGATPTEGAAARVALELLPRDGRDRIVLATMPAPPTLEAGWRTAREWLASAGSPLGAGVRLWMPKVDFAAGRTLDELVGAEVVGRAGTFVRDARERIELTLSESGARFTSAASMSVGCASSPSYATIVFDRPFLLALTRAGASRPYFLAWFANDELFVRE